VKTETPNEFELQQSVRAAAEEIMEWNSDATDVFDLVDAIHEQAEGLLNVYYYGCTQEWVAVGMPTLEDFDLEIHNLTNKDIHAQISTIMFCWYKTNLERVVEELIEVRTAQNEVNA
jgi:hypothetical protein